MHGKGRSHRQIEVVTPYPSTTCSRRDGRPWPGLAIIEKIFYILDEPFTSWSGQE